MAMLVRRPPAILPLRLTGGTIADQLQVLTEAINGKADIQGEPAFNAILLRSPDGTTWRVTVDDAGLLLAEAMTR